MFKKYLIAKCMEEGKKIPKAKDDFKTKDYFLTFQSI